MLEGLASLFGRKQTGDGFTQWRQGAGVGDDVYGTLDADSLKGLNQAYDANLSQAGGLTGSNYMGLAGLGIQGLQGLTGLLNYGLAKDKYKADLAYRNELLNADKTKYNNAIARTEAVNAVYGSPNVASKV